MNRKYFLLVHKNGEEDDDDYGKEIERFIANFYSQTENGYNELCYKLELSFSLYTSPS